jgi:signal transduction histidine kinase
MLAYWIGIVATHLAMSILTNQDEPLVMALYVVVLATALMVPWNAAWEGLVTFASLIAFTAASLIGVIEPTDVERWIILAAVAAFGITFKAMQGSFDRQRGLSAALREGRDRLVMAREAALKASKAKSEFLSSMSHQSGRP